MVVLSRHAQTTTTSPTGGERAAAEIAARDRHASDLIRASMELKLHGQVPKELRRVLHRRQERAASGYDPLKW